MVDSVKKPEKAAGSEPVIGSDGASLVPKYPQYKQDAASPDPQKSPEKAPELTQENWDKENKPKAWNETVGGRLAIRTFSRGVMGAMFFTAGGLWARRMMMGDKHITPYNAETSDFSKIVFEEKNALQFIAKSIDTFVGKPIESTVNLFSHNSRNGSYGLRATHFKPTKYSKFYPSINGIENNINKGKVYGRSLGEEAVFATFDFFCASVGDAMGRDIAGWFDPAVKKEWLSDKGIKWPEAVKSLGKSMWQYVSYNGGEDWAVAIPYVYFVRAHRKLMDHVSPGYRYESDIAMNASSLKVNTGVTPHHVAGSYTLEAMFDYQSRFTVYNIGTLMYRELYDKAAHALKGDPINLYGAPDAMVNKNASFLNNTVDVLKWVARSTVKGFFIMTPAVPLFSITRATQNRDRALFIDPNVNAALGFKGADGDHHYVEAGMLSPEKLKNGVREHGITPHTPVSYAAYNPEGNKGHGQLMGIGNELSARHGNPSALPGFDSYQRRHNLMENFFSYVGSVGNKLSHSMDGIAEAADRNHNKGAFSWVRKSLRTLVGLRVEGGTIKGLQGPGAHYTRNELKKFTQGAINASMSYTPYMFMKAETARLWDHGKMDYALERAIDGAAKLNWAEFKSGVGDTWNAFLHRPFEDAVRDAEGERRRDIDTSAADAQSDEDAKQTHRQQHEEWSKFKLKAKTSEELHKPFAEAMDEVAKKHDIKPRGNDGLTHRERLVAGNKTDVQPLEATLGYAGREEYRKILEESNPLNTLAI